ncbi:hypothetical protein [Streptomyces sp. 21So2-11]|uniref:hypothetical protein n=1 Tax=Streptomyces sp. 21So2-11 TaxID=3144408 RepID=UPI00321A606B
MQRSASSRGHAVQHGLCRDRVAEVFTRENTRRGEDVQHLRQAAHGNSHGLRDEFRRTSLAEYGQGLGYFEMSRVPPGEAADDGLRERTFRDGFAIEFTGCPVRDECIYQERVSGRNSMQFHGDFSIGGTAGFRAYEIFHRGY